MIIFDAFFRFSGVGLLLFMSVLVLKDLPRSPTKLYLLLANFCIVSHFMGFTPDVLHLPHYVRMLLRFLDVPMLLFLWLFALSLFQKDFKLGVLHLIVSLIYCFPMYMERMVQFGFINQLPEWWALLVNGINLLLIFHMLAATVLGRTDDLVEERRRSRNYLVLITAFCAIVVVVAAHLLLVNGLNQFQPTVNVLGIWPALVVLSFWLAGINQHKLLFDTNKSEIDETLSARDLDLKKKLDFAMVENQLFLEPSILIDDLARNLGVNTYRLRAFINQKLGFKNFSSYVNSYRVDAIKQAFLKAENNHIPILTLAMNHGFNSLPPFNRAFKSTEGITPTEFRQKFQKS